LVEVLIGVTVFSIVALAVYEGYRSMYGLTLATKQKVIATALANEQLEVIRNMPYADVGISGSVPAGKLVREQTLSRGGFNFRVLTTIRNVDDTFDGVIGGTPSDTSPADYKFVQLDISCVGCKQFQPFNVATYVAPKSLELSSGNGALFVRVFNANGQPVEGATVEVQNSEHSPPISITDTTNKDGILQLVDIPPGNEAYSITVQKDGYSQDRTYKATAVNPYPVKPPATVEAYKLTQVSFAIDVLSELTIKTVDEACTPVGNVPFTITGVKVIGINPDKPKYTANLATGTDGQKNITELEWDDYNLEYSGVDLLRSVVELPLKLSPNKGQVQTAVIKQSVEPVFSLLVQAKDEATGEVITSAAVSLKKDGVDVPATLDCVPEGYTVFTSLSPESYHLSLTADGYQPVEKDVIISSSWQSEDIIMNKQ